MRQGKRRALWSDGKALPRTKVTVLLSADLYVLQYRDGGARMPRASNHVGCGRHKRQKTGFEASPVVDMTFQGGKQSPKATAAFLGERSAF